MNESSVSVDSRPARPIQRALHLARIGAPVLLASAILDGGFALFLIAVQAFLPDTVHAGTASPGYALALYGLTRVLLQGPGGLLARRFGTQRLMVFSLFCGAGALMVLATAHSTTEAYLLTFLYGVATAFAWPAIYLRASDLVEEERGELFGLLTLFAMGGMAVGLGAGTLLVDLVPHRMLILGAAFCLALGGGIVTGLLAWHRRLPVLHVRVAKPNRPLRDREGLARLFVALTLQGLGVSMLLPILRHYMHQQLHLEMQSLAVLGTPGALCGALTFLAAGRLADRIGRAPVVAIGSVLAALGVLAIAAATGQMLFIIGVAPLAVGYAMSAPALGAWISDLADDAGGSVGLALTVQGLSFAIGPALSGYLVASSGAPLAIRLSAIFWLCTGVCAIVPLRSRLRRRGRRGAGRDGTRWAPNGE